MHIVLAAKPYLETIIAKACMWIIWHFLLNLTLVYHNVWQNNC